MVNIMLVTKLYETVATCKLYNRSVHQEMFSRPYKSFNSDSPNTLPAKPRGKSEARDSICAKQGRKKNSVCWYKFTDRKTTEQQKKDDGFFNMAWILKR